MAKVHISLVGGQPNPIADGIRHVAPDKVILIYSDDARSKENVDKIINYFNNSQISFEKRKFDASDMDDISKKIISIQQQYTNDDISINISSGTKPWAYYFTTIMGKNQNVEIFYIDQNSVLWNMTKQEKCEIEFDMEQRLLLYFGAIPIYRDYAELSKDIAKDAEICNNLYNFNPKMFAALAAKARKLSNDIYWEQGDNFLDWDKKEQQLLCHLSKKTNGVKIYEQTLGSPMARKLFVNAGWFEYKVAKLFSKWDKVKSIWWDCEFKTKSNTPLNEVDLILNLGKRLLFVECKTKIDSPTDLDKFTSAARNFSGMSTIGLFVSNNPIDDSIKLKCKYNGLMYYSLQENNTLIDPLIAEIEKKLNTQNS